MRLSLVVVAALATPALAQPLDWSRPPALTEEAPFAPPHAMRQALEGGGTLLVVENHDLPLVTAVFAFAGAGSAADPADKAGLAGYTADVLDEGAGGLDARTLAERLEILGTQVSTWAEQDAAFVSVSALADKFPRSVELAGTIMTAPAFDPGEARRVHEDRTTSIQLRRDRPGAVAQLILMRAIHGELGSYGHPILGTARSLAAVTLEDARAFYRQRYGRDRLIVVVAGDVDAAQAKQLVEKSLAGWRAESTPATAAAAARTAAVRRASRLLVVDRPGAEQSNILIGAPGLRRDDPRAFALDVLMNLLGGTFTSRLSHRLREELGYTYGISAGASYLRETGHWGIETAIFTPRTGAGLREIGRILTAVRQKAVPADELAATKRNLVRALPLYFATNADIADAVVGLALNGLPEDWFDSYAARIDAVTAADVKALAGQLLAPRVMVTVVVGTMAAVRKDLARLGLGAPAAFDADGEPRR